MNQQLGYIKEKIGRSVNKLIVLRNVGELDEKRRVVTGFEWTQNAKKKPVAVPVYVEKQVHLIKYRVVSQHYFGEAEQWFILDKFHVYDLLLENESYGRGEVHVQFKDYDTGASLFFDGNTVLMSKGNPQTLSVAIETNHLVKAIEALKPLAASVMVIVLCLAAGGFIGFTIGQNAGAISHLISHSSGSPAPAWLLELIVK